MEPPERRYSAEVAPVGRLGHVNGVIYYEILAFDYLGGVRPYPEGSDGMNVHGNSWRIEALAVLFRILIRYLDGGIETFKPRVGLGIYMYAERENKEP